MATRFDKSPKAKKRGGNPNPFWDNPTNVGYMAADASIAGRQVAYSRKRNPKGNPQHRVSYGESTNASAMDRASTDEARARLPKGSPSSAKASAKASSGQSASGSGSVAIKKAAEAPSATKATPVAKPKPKPATEAPKASQSPPKPKAKPSFSKGPADGKMSFKADNPVGNWKGAAATEMQKRGGARINRGGGLLGKLRGK